MRPRTELLRASVQSARAHLGWLLAGLGLVVAGLLVGAVAIGVGSRHTGELAFDVDLSRQRTPFEEAIARGVQVGIGPLVAPLVLLLVCLLAWLVHRQSAVLIAVLTIAGWLSVVLGKLAFQRARPPASVVHALVHETGSNSFPSGHTAFAAALVCAVVVALRVHGRRIWAAVVGGAVLVGVVAMSRLVAGAHFFLDVIAAPMFAVGTIVVLCAVGGPAWHRFSVWLDDRGT